jgi:hypothetical protein
LIAVFDPRGIPDRATDPKRFGTWVENACLAFAWNAGQRVSYWREEPLEVDGVLEGSWGSWVLEVKTGSISSADLKGMAEFVRRKPKYRPLVLCDDEARPVVERVGIESMVWRDFLLHGPPIAA